MAYLQQQPLTLKNTTYETIRKAYEKASDPRNILCVETGRPGSINVSDILTKLIQVAGRFAESYASDLVYSIDHIRELADNTWPYDTAQPMDEIMAVGIRASGVDGNSFIMSRLLSTRQCGPWDYVYPEHIYRKILAVGIKVVPSQEGDYLCMDLSFELRDITHQIINIDPDDLVDGAIKTLPPEN